MTERKTKKERKKERERERDGERVREKEKKLSVGLAQSQWPQFCCRRFAAADVVLHSLPLFSA